MEETRKPSTWIVLPPSFRVQIQNIWNHHLVNVALSLIVVVFFVFPRVWIRNFHVKLYPRFICFFAQPLMHIDTGLKQRSSDIALISSSEKVMPLSKALGNENQPPEARRNTPWGSNRFLRMVMQPTWNAKCPIFWATLPLKPATIAVKKRALGFPGKYFAEVIGHPNHVLTGYLRMSLVVWGKNAIFLIAIGSMYLDLLN